MASQSDFFFMCCKRAKFDINHLQAVGMKDFLSSVSIDMSSLLASFCEEEVSFSSSEKSTFSQFISVDFILMKLSLNSDS